MTSLTFVIPVWMIGAKIWLGPLFPPGVRLMISVRWAADVGAGLALWLPLTGDNAANIVDDTDGLPMCPHGLLFLDPRRMVSDKDGRTTSCSFEDSAVNVAC